MKTQITITTQITFLADITPTKEEALQSTIANIERNVPPGLTGYQLALASYIGQVDLQHHETDVTFQPACRVCGCTDDNCEQCIEATGEACHWVEDDLCSRCAETITSPSDGAQIQES